MKGILRFIGASIIALFLFVLLIVVTVVTWLFLPFVIAGLMLVVVALVLYWIGGKIYDCFTNR